MAKRARKKTPGLAWRCPRQALTFSNPEHCQERQTQARKLHRQRRGAWMFAELHNCRDCPGPEVIK